MRTIGIRQPYSNLVLVGLLAVFDYYTAYSRSTDFPRASTGDLLVCRGVEPTVESRFTMS
jgi:hypothetical protein